MKKRIAILASVFIMIIMLVACNKEEKQEVDNKTTVSETTNTPEDKKDEVKSDEKNEEALKTNEKEEKDTKQEEEKKNDLNKNDSNTKESEKSEGANKEDNKENVGSDTESNNNQIENPKPTPEVKPEVQPVSKYVTISITCNTLLNNMDKVDSSKKDIIPSNGVILGERTVEIKDGDTVFDVLKRETRENRIHMDFVESPVYQSVYIKGIANIYEFDGGNLSGWMYSVNGVFPNYGASKYELKSGDKIEWKYTCDLGADLGHGL